MAHAANTAQLKPFDASDYHVGVVVGLFNSHLTGPMREYAVETLTETYRVPKAHIHTIEVAGSADAPAALEALARRDEIDCMIMLGAIIRGDTAHFDYVAKIVTEGVTDVQIKHAKPIAFGVLTVDTEKQAEARLEHARSYAAAALHATRNIKSLS